METITTRGNCSTSTRAGDGTAYQAAFARYLAEDAQAFAFWKGRVALYAILKALDIGPGDEVILPGYTCVVVPNAIRLAGALPIYADIVPGSYNIDLSEVARRITSRTKAVIVQHTYGIPACINEAVDLAQSRGIYLLEDCAHTLGTRLNGRHLGLFGHAAFFSSQWSKPYTTGLGGIAVTRDPEIADRLAEVQGSFRQPPFLARLRIWLQCQAYKYLFHPRLYWNAQSLLHLLSRLGLFVGSSTNEELEGDLPRDHEWRMPAYQQRLGLEQLRKYPTSLKRRRMISDNYDRGLSSAGWPYAERLSEAVLLRYPVRVSNKLELLEAARQARVELGSWFETPLHPTPLEKHSLFGYTLGQCLNAEKAARETVNLPLHDRITEKEADQILDFFIKNANRP